MIGWALGGCVVVPLHGQDTGRNAGTIVTAGAPVFLLPDSARTPLATLPAGTVVRVLDIKGDWVNIEFRDERFGPRIAYVQSMHVKREDSTAAREFEQRLAAGRLAAAKSAERESSTGIATPESTSRCRRIDCISPNDLMNARPPLLVNPRISETVERQNR